jgi:hypothetical protein
MSRNRRDNHFFLWINLLAAAIFLVGLGTVAAADGLLPGTKAPDFRLSLSDGSGGIGLSDFLNKKVVIVHFWKSK